MTVRPPQILIVGAADRPEMAGLLTAAYDLTYPHNIHRVEDLNHAIRVAAEHGWWPDIVVICQAWPGEFRRSDVEDLLSRFPLARFLIACGRWCDSDGRTQSLWPAGVRVPASDAAHRFRTLVSLLESADPVGAVSFLSAGMDEIYAADVLIETSVWPSWSGLRVAFDLRDRSFREMLTRAVESRGATVVALAEETAPHVLFWDADPATSDRMQELSCICGAMPRTHVVALMGFWDAKVASAIRIAGAASVSSKLAPLGLLLNLPSHPDR